MANVNPFKRSWHLYAVNLAAAFIVMLIFSKGWHTSFKTFAITYFWNFSIFITQWIVIVYININYLLIFWLVIAIFILLTSKDNN